MAHRIIVVCFWLGTELWGHSLGHILRFANDVAPENLPSQPPLRFLDPNRRLAFISQEVSVDKLRAMSSWGELQPNYPYYQMGQTDPDFEKSWGLLNFGQMIPGIGEGHAGNDIGAVRAWDIHSGDTGVIVAVLDSGVALNHEEFRNILINGREIYGNDLDDDHNGFIDDLYGWNFVSETAQVEDDSDHGTLVSGIIGASSDNGRGSQGVLKNVGLLPVKVLDANGFGTTKDVVSGIYYAVSRGARILNLSFGGTEYDPALFETIRWAAEQGVLVVAAAGNSARNNDTSAKPTFPASFRLPNIISVAAYDSNDSLADFSNYGKQTVHIGAPGVAIYGPSRSGYRFGSGTSFAAPFVAGSAALVLSAFSYLSVQALIRRLFESSDVIGFYERERTLTAGRIRVDYALEGRVIERPAIHGKWVKRAYSLVTPTPYAANSKYRYELYDPNARALRVLFKKFQTEADYDVVSIQDSEGKKVIAYSGDLGEFTSAVVLGNHATIEFNTDASKQLDGFYIHGYEALE